MIDAFLYLAVLVSIIFGLAIQQVLEGYRRLILTRSRIRWHVPTIIWTLLVLLMVAQNWWESFGLASRAEWDFLSFGIILGQAILLYMLAAVILPEGGYRDGADLPAHYMQERKAIYAFASAYLVSSPLRALIVDGTILPPLDFLFHGAFLALFALLAFAHRNWIHIVGVLALLCGFVAYIAVMTPVLALR